MYPNTLFVGMVNGKDLIWLTIGIKSLSFPHPSISPVLHPELQP
jgi:hypothetical protein